VALAVLLLADVLAVCKPQGLTAAGARAVGEKTKLGVHSPPAWMVRLKRLALAGALAFKRFCLGRASADTRKAAPGRCVGT
jgi:hypothetical protein